MRTMGIVTIGILLLGSVSGLAGEPPARLELAIQTIQQELNPTLATMAYARAAAEFPNSAKLHDAYMRRMLALDLPELAYHPAGLLVKLDADNALAWAAVAHMHARRGEFEQALPAAIKAAELKRDDPFVLDVAGQLIAWYDHEADKDEIPKAVRQALEKLRPKLVGQEAFDKAYQAAEAFFEQADRETVFVPEHLAAAATVAREREERIRKLIDELDRRQEELREERSYILEPWYGISVRYYGYYPYFYGFRGSAYYGYPLFVHWHWFHHLWDDHRRHRRPGRLIVTPRSQRSLYGGLVVTPRYRSISFGYSGSKFSVHGSIGSLPGSRTIIVGGRRPARVDHGLPGRPRPSLRTITPDRPRPSVRTITPDRPRPSARAITPDRPRPSARTTTPDRPRLSLPAIAPERPRPSLRTITPERPRLSLPTIAPERPRPSVRTITPEQPRPSLRAITPERPRPSARTTTPDRPRPSVRTITPERPRPSLRTITPDRPRPSVRTITPERPRLSLPTMAPAERPRPAIRIPTRPLRSIPSPAERLRAVRTPSQVLRRPAAERLLPARSGSARPVIGRRSLPERPAAVGRPTRELPGRTGRPATPSGDRDGSDRRGQARRR